MRIGSASGIAGHGDFSLILPVPDGETLPNYFVYVIKPIHLVAQCSKSTNTCYF